MDLNEAKKLIGTMQKLEAPRQGGKQKPGTYHILIEKISMEKSKIDFSPYIVVKSTVINAVQDGAGRTPSTEGYEGNVKGDPVGSVFKFGVYFQKNFSGFLCAALDIDPKSAEEIPADDIQSMALELVSCEGQEVGALDGKVVLEIRAVESAPKPDKKDPSKLTTFVNTFYNKRIPFAKVAEYLDEADITRYFRAVDNFNALLEQEASEG